MAIMIADRYRLTVMFSIVRVIVTESGGGVNSASIAISWAGE
jgi:hypothetical protein